MLVKGAPVQKFRITVYPRKYAHGFVVLCFVVVMQSFIMNSHEVFIHIHQGCFAGIGAIVRLPQCQWSKPDGYGEISQCITTTKHSKAKTVCIFLGIYCILPWQQCIFCLTSEASTCKGFVVKWCVAMTAVIFLHGCNGFSFPKGTRSEIGVAGNYETFVPDLYVLDMLPKVVCYNFSAATALWFSLMHLFCNSSILKILPYTVLQLQFK